MTVQELDIKEYLECFQVILHYFSIKDRLDVATTMLDTQAETRESAEKEKFMQR